MAASEQAHLIAELKAKGYTEEKLAALSGRSKRYIVHARESEAPTGESGGKGQNLIPLLRELNERGKVSPEAIPERRKAKSGQEAAVRKGVTTQTTQSGVQRTITTVKRGPATLMKSLDEAAEKNQFVKWTITAAKVRTKSDPAGHRGYVTDSTPGGWSAHVLLDRVNNPRAGDPWKSGDINAALKHIAVASQHGAVTSISGIEQISMWAE